MCKGERPDRRHQRQTNQHHGPVPNPRPKNTNDLNEQITQKTWLWTPVVLHCQRLHSGQTPCYLLLVKRLCLAKNQPCAIRQPVIPPPAHAMRIFVKTACAECMTQYDSAPLRMDTNDLSQPPKKTHRLCNVMPPFHGTAPRSHSLMFSSPCCCAGETPSNATLHAALAHNFLQTAWGLDRVAEVHVVPRHPHHYDVVVNVHNAAQAAKHLIERVCAWPSFV